MIDERIMAVDLSLRATGIVLPDGQSLCVGPPEKVKGPARLEWWRGWFARCLNQHQPDHLVFERPFVHVYHDKQVVLELGRLYGVVELTIWRWGDTTDRMFPSWVEPSRLKKWATGRGNATKEEMVAAAQRRWNYDGDDDNEADALHLWHFAREARR